MWYKKSGFINGRCKNYPRKKQKPCCKHHLWCDERPSKVWITPITHWWNIEHGMNEANGVKKVFCTKYIFAFNITNNFQSSWTVCQFHLFQSKACHAALTFILMVWTRPMLWMWWKVWTWYKGQIRSMVPTRPTMLTKSMMPASLVVWTRPMM